MGFVIYLVVVLLVLSSTLLAYAGVARDLPAPGGLVQRSIQFETTRIYDRNGQLLQEPLAPDDPGAGLRRRVALDEVSPYLVQATIATEDANFYRHPGIDAVGLTRALYQALRTRGPVAGTSTISQQLVKLVFLSPERDLSRKLKEAILAAEITRRYDKDTVLELYLNEIYYGNLSYGIEAAAQLYFDVPASDLSLAQAALLAGLPQSPATYDPLQNPTTAKARQADVLRLMVEGGYITPVEADAAWQEQLRYSGRGLDGTRLDRAPHFVMHVRSEIEQAYGPELLYRGGLQVYTTLDSSLQRMAETAVGEGVERLRGLDATNGALVAMRPGTGEILAMVGSADFNNPEIDGQVNVALAPRQPGSAIKPFTYLATFEHPDDWWTPATLIDDVRTEFGDGPGRPAYVPVNYDDREHGRVSVRTALANSYNIPAVKALQHVGVEALLDVAARFGMETLTRPDHPPYGLALTLGGGETTLLELTGAYGGLANGGVYAPPAAILCVVDAKGQVLERLNVPSLPEACQTAPLAPDAWIRPPSAWRALRGEHAYLVTDILKDNDARSSVFGANSSLRLNRPAAAKTGTTNDVRDGWTVGYTPDLVTGVWVGNSDGRPMNQRLSGSQVAAPIWNQFMTQALQGTALQDFAVPAGVKFVEICGLTGAVADSSCPPERRRTEVFAADQLPPGADLSRYHVLLLSPQDGEVVQDVVEVVGSVAIPDFDHYLVEYGESFEPGAWGTVSGPVDQPVEAGVLALWDVRTLSKDGPHVLRVVAVDKRGLRVESPVARVMVFRPTPTATQTRTPTPTLTPTSTPTPTSTLQPSSTPTASPVPTETPAETLAPPPLEPTATPTLPAATSPLPTPTATPLIVGPSPTSEPSVLLGVLWDPLPGSIVGGTVIIRGQVGGTNFLSYRLDFRQDGDWIPVDPARPEYVNADLDLLGQWDTRTVTNGPAELRLLVRGMDGETVETRETVVVAN